jgi:hypothetical protein
MTPVSREGLGEMGTGIRNMQLGHQKPFCSPDLAFLPTFSYEKQVLLAFHVLQEHNDDKVCCKSEFRENLFMIKTN